MWHSGDQSAKVVRDAKTSTSVASNTFTLSGHGMIDGDAVYPTVANNGLSTTTRYYVNAASSSTFTLHPTMADALAGTSVVTLSGTTNTTFNRYFDAIEAVYAVPTGAAMDGSAGVYVRDVWAVDGVVNPVWFGADPTGAAGSSDAFWRALNLLNSVIHWNAVQASAQDYTGGILEIPPGAYQFDYFVDFYPENDVHINIRGAGSNVTMLFNNASNTSGVLSLRGTATGIKGQRVSASGFRVVANAPGSGVGFRFGELQGGLATGRGAIVKDVIADVVDTTADYFNEPIDLSGNNRLRGEDIWVQPPFTGITNVRNANSPALAPTYGINCSGVYGVELLGCNVQGTQCGYLFWAGYGEKHGHITAIANNGGTLRVTTSNAHNFVNGDSVTISALPTYHDAGTVSNVSTNQFDIDITYTSAMSGTDFTKWVNDRAIIGGAAPESPLFTNCAAVQSIVGALIANPSKEPGSDFSGFHSNCVSRGIILDGVNVGWVKATFPYNIDVDKTVTAIADQGGGTTRFTTNAAHGLIVGDGVYVDATGYARIKLTITAVPTTTTFEASVAFTAFDVGQPNTVSFSPIPYVDYDLQHWSLISFIEPVIHFDGHPDRIAIEAWALNTSAASGKGLHINGLTTNAQLQDVISLQAGCTDFHIRGVRLQSAISDYVVRTQAGVTGGYLGAIKAHDDGSVGIAAFNTTNAFEGFGNQHYKTQNQTALDDTTNTLNRLRLPGDTVRNNTTGELQMYNYVAGDWVDFGSGTDLFGEIGSTAAVVAVSGGVLDISAESTKNIRASQETGTTDDVDTITMNEGAFAAIRPSADTIVIRDNSVGGGNIYLPSAVSTVSLGGVHAKLIVAKLNGRVHMVQNFGGTEA